MTETPEQVIERVVEEVKKAAWMLPDSDKPKLRRAILNAMRESMPDA